MFTIITRWPAVGAALLCFTATEATTLDDMGYTQLQAELGLATPVGAGVLVSQVEGNLLMDPDYAYLPETGNAELTGKTITDASAMSTAPSGHATAVAQMFYGNTMASARGVTNINGYLVDHWMQTGYLRVEESNPTGPWPLQSARRVANHSWIGGYEATADNTNALRRVDWLVERDDFLQVVAYALGSAPLLSSAFNVISADWTGALPTSGSAGVDAIYTAGRTRPDVVAPIDSPSQATAIVSSATALLVGVGQSSSTLSTDLSASSTTNRNGNTIYNASRSEVIKAALMAGADRFTRNSTGANITDYRANAGDQATNGLDRRYGAGQVNVRNSYWIIASGEKNSTEDGGPGSGSATQGFDYDPHFGGTASNSQANYPLPVSAAPQLLTAALVWTLDIAGGTAGNFNGTAVLRDFELRVIDLANSGATVALSQSTIDNSENAWIVIPAGGQYALRVARGSGAAFDYDYALAWQLLPDTDADGIHDGRDNCVNVANPTQTDTELDGRGDACDNCTLVANNTGAGAQCDSDGDGFGNRCDGDFGSPAPGNGVTNAQDYVLLRAQLGQPSGPPAYNAADLNCNGTVNAQDYVVFKALLGFPPGPSGLVP